MSTLSNNDEKKLLHILAGYETTAMVVIPKSEFGSATPKKLAHYCFHRGILFYWSNANYMFTKRMPT